MKFTIDRNESFFIDGKVIVFVDGAYETEDAKEIEVLKQYCDFEETKAGRKGVK